MTNNDVHTRERNFMVTLSPKMLLHHILVAHTAGNTKMRTVKYLG